MILNPTEFTPSHLLPPLLVLAHPWPQSPQLPGGEAAAKWIQLALCLSWGPYTVAGTQKVGSLFTSRTSPISREQVREGVSLL